MKLVRKFEKVDDDDDDDYDIHISDFQTLLKDFLENESAEIGQESQDVLQILKAR